VQTELVEDGGTTKRASLALALTLALAVAACASGPAATAPTLSVAPSATRTASAEPTASPFASASPTAAATSFPTEAFAGIGEGPIAGEQAATLQRILTEAAGTAGVAVTVISPDGTWSGATGKADGVRDLRVDDQFAIASITKSVVAAQVMQMVEAGELALDDLAADHLPADLDFDTNQATIRQLLGHRSGLPGYDPALFDPGVQASPSDDLKRAWSLAEMLEMVLAERDPAGEAFAYTNTNYLLLGLVIEHVRGRPIAEVLREGVLSVDGVERLIYQPDEMPSEPMAMPFGASTDVLEAGGGYLPSLAAATSDGPAAAMASDSLSLARWWRSLCAGEVVSRDSLTEMTTMRDGYGLGLYEPDPRGTVGHSGEHIGYMALAGCLPADGLVVVVLSNDIVDTSAVARPLVDAIRSR
jgi:D-alanyl-D-alanine carboxypeptidase